MNINAAITGEFTPTHTENAYLQLDQLTSNLLNLTLTYYGPEETYQQIKAYAALRNVAAIHATENRPRTNSQLKTATHLIAINPGQTAHHIVKERRTRPLVADSHGEVIRTLATLTIFTHDTPQAEKAPNPYPLKKGNGKSSHRRQRLTR